MQLIDFSQRINLNVKEDKNHNINYTKDKLYIKINLRQLIMSSDIQILKLIY